MTNEKDGRRSASASRGIGDSDITDALNERDRLRDENVDLRNRLARYVAGIEPQRSSNASHIEAVAVEVLKCAVAHEPNVLLLGNVRADDVAKLAASVAERATGSAQPDEVKRLRDKIHCAVSTLICVAQSVSEDATNHRNMLAATIEDLQSAFTATPCAGSSKTSEHGQEVTVTATLTKGSAHGR